MKISDISPTGDKVLVKLEELTNEDFGSGILEIPEVAKDGGNRVAVWGLALSVGPRVHEVKRGDRVAFRRGVQTSSKGLDGYAFIAEPDILLAETA